MTLTQKLRAGLLNFSKLTRAIPATFALIAAGCASHGNSIANLPSEYTKVVLAPVAFTNANNHTDREQFRPLTLAVGESFAFDISDKGYLVFVADPQLAENLLNANGIKKDKSDKRTRYALIQNKRIAATFDSPKDFAAKPDAITAYGRIDSVAKPAANPLFADRPDTAGAGYTTFNVTFQKDGVSFSTHGQSNERQHGAPAETLQPDSAKKYAHEILEDLPSRQ